MTQFVKQPVEKSRNLVQQNANPYMYAFATIVLSSIAITGVYYL